MVNAKMVRSWDMELSADFVAWMDILQKGKVRGVGVVSLTSVGHFVRLIRVQ
jgi:hypothetical protein